MKKTGITVDQAIAWANEQIRKSPDFKEGMSVRKAPAGSRRPGGYEFDEDRFPELKMIMGPITKEFTEKYFIVD